VKPHQRRVERSGAPRFEKVEPTVAYRARRPTHGDQALRKYVRVDGLTSRQLSRFARSSKRHAMSSREFDDRCNRRPAISAFVSAASARLESKSRGAVSRTDRETPRIVGCYVPAAHPLVSTLHGRSFRTSCGVAKIRVASPNPARVLAAAHTLVSRTLPRGGSGDCGARLRHPSVPRVDRSWALNLYVTVAKKLVSFDCAIDFLAGRRRCHSQRARPRRLELRLYAAYRVG